MTRWTQEQVDDAHQAKISRGANYMPDLQVKKKHHETNIPVSPANLEQGISNELLGAQEAAGLNGPACIHIHSLRKRLTDADGACAKYLIDAIIDAGVLPDDSATYVKEVTHSQEKTKGSEITEVTIS